MKKNKHSLEQEDKNLRIQAAYDMLIDTFCHKIKNTEKSINDVISQKEEIKSNPIIVTLKENKNKKANIHKFKNNTIYRKINNLIRKNHNRDNSYDNIIKNLAKSLDIRPMYIKYLSDYKNINNINYKKIADKIVNKLVILEELYVR